MTLQLVDLVALLNGATVLGFSDAHYGHARNVISPGRARIMAEGWETARRVRTEICIGKSQLKHFPTNYSRVTRLKRVLQVYFTRVHVQYVLELQGKATRSSVLKIFFCRYSSINIQYQNI